MTTTLRDVDGSRWRVNVGNDDQECGDDDDDDDDVWKSFDIVLYSP